MTPKTKNIVIVIATAAATYAVIWISGIGAYHTNSYLAWYRQQAMQSEANLYSAGIMSQIAACGNSKTRVPAIVVSIASPNLFRIQCLP